MIAEDFDADEILRDVDEKYVEEERSDDEVRELNFGNDENKNYNELQQDWNE